MKKTFPLGGSYVQAGIWLNRENEGKFKIATRGFSPQNTVGGVDAYRQFIFSELFETIPRAWGDDKEEHEFDYQQYMSLGVALSSRENWKLCGHWKSYKRHSQYPGSRPEETCAELAGQTESPRVEAGSASRRTPRRLRRGRDESSLQVWLAKRRVGEARRGGGRARALCGGVLIHGLYHRLQATTAMRVARAGP
jgi:hypothetical protein